MEPKIIQILAQQVGIPFNQVLNTIQLLDEGGTVPFISRYRKERTGSLDEVQIEAIKDAKDRMKNCSNARKPSCKPFRNRNY